MDCKEALAWYERQWEKDRRRWEEEKRALVERLEEQAAEILRLKSGLGEREAQLSRELQGRLEACERRLEEERAAREGCERALERLARPVLGEGFFRYLAQALELWDQALLEEARKLDGNGVEAWLRAIWAERAEALSGALAGQAPDWRRVRTGLVLEWALLAWLEGIRDG